MQGVVDEPGVPANGDTHPCGAQVSLGGHGVLVVAQPVTFVREQLHQRDPDVGDVAFGPLRHREAQTVEQQLPEALVILCQIVDFDGLIGIFLAVAVNCAVDVAAPGDEPEVQARVARIEILDVGNT